MSSAPGNCEFPADSPELLRRLAAHNRRWTELGQNCWRHLPDAGPGALYMEHDWRLRLNTFLPWSQFRQSLRAIARAFLPDEAWLPFPLTVTTGVLGNLAPREAPDNLADFWELLPDDWWGRLTFASEELLPLFCSLADPPRFGTACQRYLRQQETFRSLLAAAPAGRQLAILDLGCGVGLGTYEIAALAAQETGQEAHVIGLTREPLEVWMASRRFLPHDARRSFPVYSGCCEFQVGMASDFHLQDKFDFIFCNGLAGGRFLDSEQDLRSFLAACYQHLCSGGHLLLANQFHQGYRRGCEKLAELAATSGWIVQGDWQNLNLLKP